MLCGGWEGASLCCVGLSSIPENEWKLSCVFGNMLVAKFKKKSLPTIWKIWAMCWSRNIWLECWIGLSGEPNSFFFDFCSVVCLCVLFLWLYLSFFCCQICHETGKLVLCHNFVIGFHLTCVGLSFFCQQINDCGKAVQNIKQKWIKQKRKSWLLTNKMKTMTENDQKITSFWSGWTFWKLKITKLHIQKNLHSLKRKTCQVSVSSNEEKVCEVTETKKKQLDDLVCAQVLF